MALSKNGSVSKYIFLYPIDLASSITFWTNISPNLCPRNFGLTNNLFNSQFVLDNFLIQTHPAGLPST